jgi:hypothetical protein
MMMEHKAFYSPAEVAAILGVSVSYINGQIDKGAIAAVRLSPRVTRIAYGTLMALVGQPLSVSTVEMTDDEVAAERRALASEAAPAPSRHLIAG